MTPEFTATIVQRVLRIVTPHLELGFSLDDGGLRLLQRRGTPNIAGYGTPRPSVDISLGNQGWLSGISFTRYLSHSVEQDGDAVTILIVIGLGPLKLYDRYHLTGTLIARRLSIENAGEGEMLLRGVRLTIPWVRIGAEETCIFDAPGNSVRPRVSLAVAASQRAGVLPRRFFAPGLREGRALEPAPTFAPGLVTMHDRATGEGLLCWCVSATDTALPLVEGNGQAVSLIHEITIADRLTPATALSTGTQYILLIREPWPEILSAFRRTWQMIDHSSAPHADEWMRAAVLYEVHPAQVGGCHELAANLESLADLGVTTICLLPVWSFGRCTEEIWDGNWHTGDPYAVRDFETIDPSIGGADGLRALIDAAHARGMRVILDLPWVGCAVDSPLLQEHPEWFCYDEYGMAARAAENSMIIPFDWGNPTLRSAMHEWALALLRDFDCDGFRIVTPRSSRPNWAQRLTYHGSAGSLGYVHSIDRLLPDMRAIKADAALIADRSGPTCVVRHHLTTDELAHHMFIHTALSRMTPSELGMWLSDQRAALPDTSVRICYTESHHTRLINPLADGLRGSRISRMLLAGMVLCGYVPQIWCGQEEGEEAFIQRLFAARRDSSALISGRTLYNAVSCANPQIFAVVRINGDEIVVGVLNMSPHRHTVTLGLPVEQLPLGEGEYALHELISGAEWSEHERTTWSRDDMRALTLDLAPFGTYAFTLRAAKPPE